MPLSGWLQKAGADLDGRIVHIGKVVDRKKLVARTPNRRIEAVSPVIMGRRMKSSARFIRLSYCDFELPTSELKLAFISTLAPGRVEVGRPSRPCPQAADPYRLLFHRRSSAPPRLDGIYGEVRADHKRIVASCPVWTAWVGATTELGREVSLRTTLTNCPGHNLFSAF
jgi:hypothetical protein